MPLTNKQSDYIYFDEISNKYDGCDIFAGVSINRTVFWTVISYSSEKARRFGETPSMWQGKPPEAGVSDYFL
jgi:hypothetical protein